MDWKQEKLPRMSWEAELVEAAGQLIHAFRHGLDYSFTCFRTASENRGERL